jgi:hypothetical protein
MAMIFHLPKALGAKPEPADQPTFERVLVLVETDPILLGAKAK